MKQEPFVIERILPAPPARVWKAITSKEEMKQWYFDISPGFKPEVGYTFQFTGEGNGMIYVHHCEVTEVVPGSKLTYSWRYEGYEGNSFVTFELFPDGPDKTRLKLTHTGLETFPGTANKDFSKESFAAGWTEIIGKLLPTYLEKNPSV